MAQPLFWPGKRYFYPIGNTSAVCLARDAPSNKDLSLLLLGCGDPRNILFTLFSEPKSATRKLDFTCIDFEPAVLARNILLLSLVIDNKPMDQIFDIFFHLYLEPDPLALLVSQCQVLVAASATLTKWKASIYGSTLHMSSEHTLTQLHIHWKQYSGMHTLPHSKLQSILTSFKTTMAEYQAQYTGFMVHTSRSAGPLMMFAGPTMSDCFHDYWKHGTTFVSSSRYSAATLLNPTFAYTQAGIGCNVHYGTDPRTAFHLAPVFANNNNASPSHADIMKAVRAQFQDWCAAFHIYHQNKQCIVRVFFADAIFGTRALKIYRESGITKTRIPVCQWRTDSIIFDKDEYKDAPLTFDIIDTSNLDDHLGLLNVIVTSVPLLPFQGNGVLYLESLLVRNSNEDAPKDFAKKFYADLSVICVLFGLCPVDFATGYSSRGNVHELIAYEVTHRGSSLVQFHQTDPPLVDSRQLGTFLYDLYHTLFEEEDASTFWQKHRMNSSQAIAHSSLSYYCRESFVLLLRFIRDRLQISREEWIAVLDRFTQIHMADNSMKMDTLRFQDFCALMHYHGVYTMDVYRLDDNPRVGPFRLWTRVPPLVRVFLKVPRDKLALLTKDGIATPTLEAGMRGQRMHNMFCSIGLPTDPKVAFEEDRDGFHGSKPLVISFVMPAMLLTGHGPGYDDPERISITLACNSNPSNTLLYVKSLGPYLEVHSAQLLDKDSVLVIPEQPLPVGLNTTLQAPALSGSIGSQSTTSAIFNEENDLIEVFSTRITVEDDKAKSVLQSGGQMSVKQISFGTLELDLEGISQPISFPFPVVGVKNRLRIARKSLWIEVIVPLRISFTQDGMTANPFPIPLSELLPWSIHRVNLDCLPTVNLRSKKLHGWLNPHVGAAFSKREMKARKKKEIDPLMFVKDSIHSIMVRAAGIQPKGASTQRIFALRDKATNNCDTVIFIDQLCFDLSSHTVICDGFVLPLSRTRLNTIMQHFSKLVPNMVNVGLDQGEIISWKQLLPALVERCRTWNHLNSCQYIHQGNIPLTTDMEQIPLCTCGEGKDVQKMSNVPSWKPLAKYCTRIALSPFFGVSYVETIGKTDRSCCVCRAKAGFTCPTCKKDRYCGKICQKKDWQRHKEVHHDAFEKYSV
ncbi:hypothetical protein R3P38DRAFT_3004029 [Favolaschia claudopus]|uniref:MYND-type domain-containing protein n=1 Tax=Favolaschia claudopus TaxID=2862362 RepID=A0AAW0ALY6_9AGAR